MISLLADILIASLLAPHLLPQHRLTPVVGAGVWLAALLLRATVALALAASLIFYLPGTAAFSMVTHWCVHAALPFVSAHLGLSGHQLGDLAALGPAVILTFSALSAAFGTWRTARAVKGWLGRGSLGPGPAESVIVGGSGIVIAAAGLRSPQVVVSAGALTSFDDAELAAGLEHERGHIRRRHRFVLLVAHLALAVGRVLPGSSIALRWLEFHLERDADDYAVARTEDPLALASAICKAARTRPPAPAIAWAGLAGRQGTSERLRSLLGSSPSPSHLISAAAAGLMALLALLSILLVLAAPTIAAGAPPGGGVMHQCPS